LPEIDDWRDSHLVAYQCARRQQRRNLPALLHGGFDIEREIEGVGPNSIRASAIPREDVRLFGRLSSNAFLKERARNDGILRATDEQILETWRCSIARNIVWPCVPLPLAS